MKQIKKYIITFFILIIFFILSLVIVSMFPSSWIKENVQKSSKTLKEEGNKKIYFSMSHFQYLEFDNYSDALMINTAYSIDNKTPLYSIFMARKNYIPGVTKVVIEDFVGDLESNTNKYQKLNQVDELYDTAFGDAPESYEYGRYWHGYMIFLRPLLIFLDYWQIRVLLILILAVLAICLLTEIEEQFGKIVCGIFLVALLEIDYFYIGLSLLNSPVAILMVLLAIFLLKKFDNLKDFGYIFFIAGCLVGFFDLLDYPLVVYEMGIIIYLMCSSKRRNYKANLKQDVFDIIKFGILWLLGYAITWVTKWILMDIIYHKDMVKIGVEQVLFRTNGIVDKKIKPTPLLSIAFNLLYMGVPFLLNVMFGVFFTAVYPRKITLNEMKNMLPYLIIGLIPFLWLGIFTNHSFQHAFFACRILLSTLIVIPIMFCMSVNLIFKEVKEDGKS